MGTDITVHTELLINGLWHHYGAPRIPRNYRLFSKMADIRNREVGDPDWEKPLAYQKFKDSKIILNNTCDLTRFFIAAGGVSIIYVLDLQQIKELVQWYEQTYPMTDKPHGLETDFDYILGNGWAGIPNGLITDARFVFWFDN